MKPCLCLRLFVAQLDNTCAAADRGTLPVLEDFGGVGDVRGDSFGFTW